MEVKAINKRAILESHDGEEFSLITVAKNVLCEDGTTMQDYFDSHSEPNISTKIVNSNSMSKVGQGDISLITVAKNVLCEDGTTMQDYFDSHSEPNISTKIVNSNSMSKVGQGDNVDFSDNVMNGAYEDVVLKGKSLVNVIQEPSS